MEYSLNQNKQKIFTPIFAILLVWLLATAFWWAFAFLSLPTPTPGWLDRAREVCFGKTISGLPDSQGWLTLVVPPLFLLISTLVAFQTEVKETFKALISLPVGRTVLAVLVALLFVEATLIVKVVVSRWPVSQDLQSYKRPVNLPEEYPQTTLQIKNFSLINQQKIDFTKAKLMGVKTILTFAFANCDTICPLIVKNSIQALKKFGDSNLQLVIVTLDPWRDRPSRLKAAIKMWKAPEDQTHFLSGDIEQVESVLKQFNVPYGRNLKTGFVTHPPLVYVLNEKAEIAYSFNNPSVQWIIDALKRISKPGVKLK